MKKELTKDKEWKVILFFALPMMGSNLLQATYTFADSIIVGNFVDSNALGAIGLTNAMTWLMVTFCTGLGTGISIAVSQYVGAKRERDMKQLVSSGYFIAIALGLCLALLCIVLARPILINLLETPASMQTESFQYFVIYGCGILFQMLYNVTYGILRAHGDSKGAIFFLLVASLVNVLLDLLFVIVFQWGVVGAGLATILSQAGAALASIFYLKKSLPHLLPKKQEWKPDAIPLKTILSLSLPITFQSMITAFGFLILQRLVNQFGTASIEGYAVMQRVEQFAHIPSNCFHTAISCFIGQNIGAGFLERVKKGYRATLFMGGSSSIFLSGMIILFNAPILRMFSITGDAFLRAQEHLVLLMCFMIVNTLYNITSGFLQGSGDVKIPAMAGFVNLSVRLLCAYGMAATSIGFRSVYWSLPFAWISACVVNLIRYRSGKWKQKKIV